MPKTNRPKVSIDARGYRPGTSAIDAVRTARERYGSHNWVLDLDIKGFFDSIDWELMLRRSVVIPTVAECCFTLMWIGALD